MRFINIINEEIGSYVGAHEAPTKDDAPLHDLTVHYGEDIYGYEAVRLFGDYGNLVDHQTINIIKQYRNRPNKPIRIYRAVPNIKKDVENKLKKLYYIINYYNKFSFFPLKNEIVYGLQDRYPIDSYSYDEQRENVLLDIHKEIGELKKKASELKLKINPGDWVTINKDYAIEHGKNEFNNNYKILTKTVKPSQLYNEGNSIHEFGYNP